MIIHLYLTFEEVGVRSVTNSQEESVNSNIKVLLVLLALETNKMSPFNTVLTKETNRIGIVEYLNVVLLCHTLTHDFCSTEVWLAHNHIHLLCQAREVHRLFAGCVTTTNDCYNTLAIEESVASSTCTDTLTTVFLLIRQTQVLCTGTCRDDYSLCFNLVATLVFEVERTTTKVGFDDRTITKVGTIDLSLLSHLRHKLVCIDSFMEAWEVFYYRCCGQLTTRLKTRIEHWLQISTSGVDCCGVSCRATTYYQGFYFLHFNILYDALCVVINGKEGLD